MRTVKGEERKKTQQVRKNKRTTVTLTPFFISRIFCSGPAEAQHLQRPSLTGLITAAATQSVQMASVSWETHSSWTLSWQIQHVRNSGNSFRASMLRSRLIKWLILVPFDQKKKKKKKYRILFVAAKHGQVHIISEVESIKIIIKIRVFFFFWSEKDSRFVKRKKKDEAK